MKRIYQLPTLVANQIAAGEVIERPASVLKELLENSLDAGSYEIHVRIEGGGTRLIEVQDNGSGICKEDLSLALSQHATSKIQTVSDLEAILSYGFRGEALASIASVSRLSLASAIEGETCGWQLKTADRGKKPELSIVPMRRGTRIEVRDLFFNTPVRRKFLKSPRTEGLHLEEVFKRITLSQFEVAFNLRMGDKLPKKYPACRTREAQTRRVRSLCGKNFVDHASYIEAEANGLKIKGWLGHREASRAQADLQYFYVNGRMVRDKVVNHALREAYQSRCPAGRYPAFVLFLELSPESVDVNVHPTKHEVRFREPRSLHAFLVYSLGQVLNSEISSTSFKRDPFLEYNKAEENNNDERKKLPPKMSKISEIINETKQKALKPLSLLNGEYLMAENEAGWVLVDIKAARKLLALKDLQREYQKTGVKMRPLLLPQAVKLGIKLVEKINAEVLSWKKFGFEFSASAIDTIIIRGLPAIFDAPPSNFEIMLGPIFESQQEVDILEKIAEGFSTSSFSISEAADFLSKLEDSFIEDRLIKNKVLSETNISKIYRQLALQDLKTFFK